MSGPHKYMFTRRVCVSRPMLTVTHSIFAAFLLFRNTPGLKQDSIKQHCIPLGGGHMWPNWPPSQQLHETKKQAAFDLLHWSGESYIYWAQWVDSAS